MDFPNTKYAGQIGLITLINPLDGNGGGSADAVSAASAAAPNASIFNEVCYRMEALI